MKILTLIILCFVKTTLAQVWFGQATGIPDNLYNVTFPSVNTGYVFGDKVYMKTTNAGGSWVISQMNAVLLNASFINDATGYVLGRSPTTPDSQYVLKTINGGQTWSKYSFVDGSYISKIQFIDQNTGFMFSRSGNYKLRKTTNGGISWLPVEVTNNTQDYTVFQSTLLETRYVEYPPFIYPAVTWSTNNGTNWNSKELRENVVQNYKGLVGVIPSSSMYYLFCGTSNPQYCIKSENSGFTWEFVGYIGGVAPNELYSISELNLYGFSSSQFSATIQRTTNGGSTWQSVSLNAQINSVKFVNALTGYAVGNNGVMYKTTNGGMPIGIANITSEIPTHYELRQNYPNPFNPSTQIRFSLPHQESISLIIYNIQGKEVETLFTGIKEAGSYEYEFDGSSLTSGVYFYRLKTNHFTDTKRMIVLK